MKHENDAILRLAQTTVMMYPTHSHRSTEASRPQEHAPEVLAPSPGLPTLPQYKRSAP